MLQSSSHENGAWLTLIRDWSPHPYIWPFRQRKKGRPTVDSLEPSSSRSSFPALDLVFVGLSGRSSPTPTVVFSPAAAVVVVGRGFVAREDPPLPGFASRRLFDPLRPAVIISPAADVVFHR
ncbi:hypothetical protein Taro_011226 [Colocasia esculenta]|uniref:Uncharacterized protein n=1 Tax=Colocasia esculenta TaxID=4460 RepID=A0A843U0Y8_COLES|nr:hypothetical protein [Colocasia esculenta]